MSRCRYQDGRGQCRRKGTGEDSLCAQHRAWSPGLGTQLGSIVDQLLAGERPTEAQIDQMIAGVAGKIMGRPMTVDDVRGVRSQFGASSGPSADLPQQDWYREAYLRAQQAAQQARARMDPEAQRAAHEKRQRLQQITIARATMGFTPKEPITKEMLKDRYRELARKLHPDLNGGSHDPMTKLNAAMEVLSKGG